MCSYIHCQKRFGSFCCMLLMILLQTPCDVKFSQIERKTPLPAPNMSITPDPVYLVNFYHCLQASVIQSQPLSHSILAPQSFNLRSSVIQSQPLSLAVIQFLCPLLHYNDIQYMSFSFSNLSFNPCSSVLVTSCFVFKSFP